VPFLKLLPENAVLFNVFRAYPGPARELLAYHEVALRGASPLGVAERELISALVSAINGCRYCRGVHTATAEVLGFAAGTVGALMGEIDKAAVDDRLKPILHYAAKLTRQSDGLTQADADAVFAVVWDDQALHDAVSVCALFNFMNRLVEGLGITADSRYFAAAAERLVAGGYAGLLKILET
jgi:uncharacterized peroxidase-related enzyme